MSSTYQLLNKMESSQQSLQAMIVIRKIERWSFGDQRSYLLFFFCCFCFYGVVFVVLILLCFFFCRYFSQLRRIFRRRMSCGWIRKQLRRNSVQLQSFDSFCCLTWLQRQLRGNGLMFTLPSLVVIQFLWGDWHISNSFHTIYEAAHWGRRNYSGDYHLRGIKPVNHRNNFDSYSIFLPYVSATARNFKTLHYFKNVRRK